MGMLIFQNVTVILMVQWLALTVRCSGVSVCVCLVCEDAGVMSAALELLTSLPLDAQVRLLSCMVLTSDIIALVDK